MNIFNMKVKNIGFAFALGLILALVSVSSAKAEGENTDLGSVVPPISASNTDGGTVPPTSGSNADDGNVVPPTGGSNTDDEGITPTPTPNPTRHSSRSGSSIANRVTSSTNVISCPVINSYMKLGADNSNTEVIKLQTFFKLVEGLDVDINGVFDSKTESAVKAFQVKYMNEVLAPWGYTLPSGNVYITTLKKINEIGCKNVREFTADEVAIINSYKTRVSSGITNNDNISSLVNLEVPEFGTIKDNSEDTIVKGDNSNQTAAVASSTSSGKLGNFFKKIFNFLLGK